MIKASEVNVVKGDGKPVLGNVFENIGRIKKPGIFKQLPYMQQRPTTPQVKKKRKRSIEFSLTAPSEHDCYQQTLQPFKEVLRRNCKSNPTKVTVPACMKSFFRNGLDENRTWWMLDDHMNVWIDLLWRFRPANADWSIVGPHFCPSILSGQMPLFYASNKRYPVPWSDVEKVYIPLNNPKTHWALAELELRTGVITVYDSMTPRKRNKKLPIQENREFWIKLRETMSQQLPVYLDRSGVLKSKGLDVTRYKINFQFSEKVPFQASVYGDYGIWVCILLFRLTHGLPLVFNDPLQTALAYRERMLAYFWKHKVSYYHNEDYVE
ncbi:phospholipase-like protein [Tanacetum coccineum]